MWVWPLGQEYPLEEGIATHPIILAWKIPWIEGPDGLQSMATVHKTIETDTTKAILQARRN